MVKGETTGFNLNDWFHTCNLLTSLFSAIIAVFIVNCVNQSSFTEQGRKAKKINKKSIGEDLNQHVDGLKSMAT